MTILSSAVMSSIALDLMLVCFFSLAFEGGIKPTIALAFKLLIEPILIFLGVISPGC